MKIGDIVICKRDKPGYIISINETHAMVVLLKTGMYMPESFKIEDLELANEN